ncbi:MAG: hypothetical protein Q7R52_03115 [archaeon]|nr:hypothetical protein [archaeon]
MVKFYVKKFGSDYYLCTKKNVSEVRHYKRDFLIKNNVFDCYFPEELHGKWVKFKLVFVDIPEVA